MASGKNAAFSLLVSAALVVPFFVLEWFTTPGVLADFPGVLFAFMSLNALGIVRLSSSALRRLWAERSLAALTLGNWTCLLLGVGLAYIYAGVVANEMPCFLGVPNCD